jgi:hypothetical protein
MYHQMKTRHARQRPPRTPTGMAQAGAPMMIVCVVYGEVEGIDYEFTWLCEEALLGGRKFGCTT